MRAMTRHLMVSLAALLAMTAAWAATPGESVVVVYNKNLPDSKKIAQHYAEKRGVPSSQLLGVDVSADSESMSRADFQNRRRS